MPQASATPALLSLVTPKAMSATRMRMSTTLSRLGAKAAMAKRPSAFSMPA